VRFRLAQPHAHVALAQWDAQHRPAGQRLHQPPAGRHNRQRIGQRQHACQAGRHIFADAVPDHRVRPHAPGQPELRQGILDGEQGRLRDSSASELFLQVAGGPREVARQDERAQVKPQVRLQQPRTLVNDRAKDRLGPVQTRRHVRVLAALAGEHERDAAVRGCAVVGRDTRRIHIGQCGNGVRQVTSKCKPAVLEGPPTRLERVGDVGKIAGRIPSIGAGRRQVRGQVRGRALQRIMAARGEGQELPRAGGAGWLARRRLLEDGMGIRAADAEGADARSERARACAGLRLPRLQARVDIERRTGEVDARIRPAVVEAGRNLAMLERQGRLDEAGDARRGVQMPNVRLERADGAELPVCGALPEDLREGRDFDGIAQRGARAVGLDVGDGARIHACNRVRGRNDLCLALDAWRGVAHLGRAVVVEGRCLDDRVDGVALGQRICQALEDHDARAVAADSARGIGVEGAAVAVRGGDAALLV